MHEQRSTARKVSILQQLKKACPGARLSGAKSNGHAEGADVKHHPQVVFAVNKACFLAAPRLLHEGGDQV